MENIIYQDSPLAEFLEGEGRGQSTPPSPTSSSASDSPTAPSFAPRGPSTLRSRIRDRLPKPLRVPAAHHGPLARIYSKAIDYKIGRTENQRFLEHFRYLIVASQLLAEHAGQSGLRATSLHSTSTKNTLQPVEYKVTNISLRGAAFTGAAAFALVWLLHWSRSRGGFSKSKLLIVLVFLALATTTGYSYMRRQWLQYLRQQAVQGGSTLVTNLQAFEASTAAALALVQEVELVSRGYRLSSPLPPISRLEEKGQARRCVRLRKILVAAFAETIPILHDQCAAVKHLIDEDSLEKYLDVYDVSNPDLQEAGQGYSRTEFEDGETLKALRTWQYRSATLRRVYLCSLLALEADGGRTDFARWSVAVESMIKLAEILGKWVCKVNAVLGEEEQFELPSPAKPQSSPARERLRASVRKLSSLSGGIRGLQAKMQILREETTKTLEDTDDVSELGSHLMAQYESIGADLRSLVQAWESGKTALALNIDRHERRVSQASSGLRSPVPSLGGLTAVGEGSPSDALCALNGETLSPRPSAAPSLAGSASDEEVFEAIAIPRTRPRMSREERMAKLQEDRIRQMALREQRDANVSVMKELETVLNFRPHRGGLSGTRVTSI